MLAILDKKCGSARAQIRNYIKYESINYIA